MRRRGFSAPFDSNQSLLSLDFEKDIAAGGIDTDFSVF